MSNLIEHEQRLHNAAESMLADTQLITILSQLGEPVITVSYQTRLMMYPDIDFAVMSPKTTYKDLIPLIPQLQSQLKPSSIKVADFAKDPKESAICALVFDFEYSQLSWHISATITKPGPIGTNPPELKQWLQNMTEEERVIILGLKKELIDAQRYAGSHSKPPYTFRSVHVYEAVLAGKAKTLKQLEEYFA